MDDDLVRQLALSWQGNADAWTHAVRRNAIPSRKQATDAAIVDSIVALKPRRVLDLGCGEGWLTRELSRRGIEVVGIDASAPLIDAARDGGGGTFHEWTYEELVETPERAGVAFDVIACNFALLEANVSPLLRILIACLAPEGRLILQTVHPWSASGAEGYRDGWRVESFAEFDAGFPEAMPWYFRTLESWVELLRETGYTVDDLREPRRSDTGQPLSLLLTLSPSTLRKVET